MNSVILLDTVTRSPAHDFPLDPSLGGQSLQTARAPSLYDHDHTDDGQDSNASLSDADRSFDEEDSEEDDETDAEDEYRVEMGGVKRKKSANDRRAEGGSKGRGKAVERDERGGGVRGLFEDKELGRLIESIRSSGIGGGGKNGLDMEFDTTIEEALDGIDDPSFPGRSKRDAYGNRKPRGRRAAADIDPSPEVKALIQSANKHYADGLHDDATRMLTEVVRIDPGLRGPWYTLATIHEERGDNEKAIKFKIIAAHLTSPKQAAAEWASLGAQSREIGLLNQAIYCFTQAIKGNKNDVDSMWDRAMLLKISGSDKPATTAFTSILAIHPFDFGVLKELATLLFNSSSYSEGSSLFTSAVEYHYSQTPHLGEDDEPSMDIGEFETLADFLLKEKKWDHVIKVIRTGVRWLGGREKETIWDQLEDDREFDVRRQERDGWEKVARALEESPVHQLDNRLRLRLGLARMGKGDIEEARMHFEIVMEEDVEKFPEFFQAIGDAYLEKKMYFEALDLYMDLAESEESNGPYVWVKCAVCHHALGDLEDARECLVAATIEEPNNLDVKMQLARLYEEMNLQQECMELLTDITTRQNAPGARDAKAGKKSSRPTQSKEDRARAARALLATEESREIELKLKLKELTSLSPRVEEGEGEATAEWLAIATEIVDGFRETRQLFPADSKKKFMGVLSRHWRRKGAKENDLETQVEEMSQRIERNLDRREEPVLVAVNEFRGLDFDGWLALIVKYAILLTKNGEDLAGQETLTHVQSASVFKQSPHRTLTLKLARATCYIHTRNYQEVVIIARWISLHYQYSNAGLRLLQCLLPAGVGAIEAFNGSGLQKYAIRQLKAIDRFAMGNEGGQEGKKGKGKEKEKGKGKGKEREKDEDEDEGEDEEEEHGERTKFVPTKLNPMWTLAYGHLMLTSASYQSSIIYFLRAYELAPTQPLVCLSLAIAYVHRSMSRQSDNRQHQLATGLTFLSQYRKVMGDTQVVEYNFGRMFQHLGLQSFAIKHYNACLALSTSDRLDLRASRMEIDDSDDEEGEAGEEGPEDYGRAAAYNLVALYMLSGQAELARVVACRWLTF